MPDGFPDPLYYLHNFQSALSWLEQRYHDLLAPDEQVFLTQFARLPLPSRALLVRMLMRRGDLFRTSRLHYPEIGDTEAALAPLAALGWVHDDILLPAQALFALCTRAELLPLLPPGLPRATTKSQQLSLLEAGGEPPRHYTQWRCDAGDRVLQVRIAPLCERLRLMFFGNHHQSWAEFVLVDLGVLRYESVPFDTASRAFRQRADVDLYLHLLACRERLELADTPAALAALVGELADLMPQPGWLQARHGKLLYQAGYRAEREQDWDTALHAYGCSSHGAARQRCIRTLERSGQHAIALHHALQALQAPQNEAEAQRLTRMLPRLRRHLGLKPAADRQGGRHAPPPGSNTAAAPAPPGLRSVTPYAAPGAIARSLLVLQREHTGISVEYAVARHLAHPGTPVHYVENSLINSLFGLLCWDAIFAPLPGAFFHPFQRGPADLLATDFHARRADRFAACLAQLDSDAYRHTILRHFHSKMNMQSPFVFWGALTQALLALALTCIPAAHLRRWFERLLQDIPENRCGLPDLVRFWPAEQRYELIEVKGPGDRLQDNQVRWLAYCVAHDMPARVIDVQWAHAAAATEPAWTT